MRAQNKSFYFELGACVLSLMCITAYLLFLVFRFFFRGAFIVTFRIRGADSAFVARAGGEAREEEVASHETGLRSEALIDILTHSSLVSLCF